MTVAVTILFTGALLIWAGYKGMSLTQAFLGKAAPTTSGSLLKGAS